MLGVEQKKNPGTFNVGFRFMKSATDSVSLPSWLLLNLRIAWFKVSTTTHCRTYMHTNRRINLFFQITDMYLFFIQHIINILGITTDLEIKWAVFIWSCHFQMEGQNKIEKKWLLQIIMFWKFRNLFFVHREDTETYVDRSTNCNMTMFWSNSFYVTCFFWCDECHDYLIF